MIKYFSLLAKLLFVKKGGVLINFKFKRSSKNKLSFFLFSKYLVIKLTIFKIKIKI